MQTKKSRICSEHAIIGRRRERLKDASRNSRHGILHLVRQRLQRMGSILPSAFESKPENIEIIEHRCEVFSMHYTGLWQRNQRAPCLALE